jgi:alkanesulfonate monooxygenase SsuD/methylene tetrahydromethanopterin reductase-like flavin-dependent oxidoreductase (luciferase family)
MRDQRPQETDGMSPPRPLAVGVTPMENRRDVITRLAALAEDLGYSGIFVAEGWGHDAGVLLAEIAVRTSRIRLGSGVLNTWGRSAAGIAMLAASLADVSEGRFILGLGAGSPALAEGFHDTAFHAPVARLGAVTRHVRRLLDGGRLVPSATTERPLRLVTPTPVDVPIYLAGLGPTAVRLCGELADGWVPFLLPASGLDAGVRLLHEGMARRSEGPRLPVIAPCLPVAVSSEPTASRDLAWWWVSFYLTRMGPLYARALRDLGLADGVDAVLAHGDGMPKTAPRAARALVDELVLWGDEEGARARLDRWYAAGAQLPVVVLPPGRSLPELEAMLHALTPSTGPEARVAGPPSPTATAVRPTPAGTASTAVRSAAPYAS